jgi:WNK lysine deficient protein kinase
LREQDLTTSILFSRVTPENSESVVASERSRVKRSGTKRKKPGIKLTVLSVSSGEGQSMTVECQLDTSKQKTVTFKFDRDDMVPTDIANNLVRTIIFDILFILHVTFTLHLFFS